MRLTKEQRGWQWATLFVHQKLCYRRTTARRNVLVKILRTWCTTNPEQIEVVESKGYVRPKCNKLCASAVEALDRHDTRDSRSYLNVRSRADISQLNLPHGKSTAPSYSVGLSVCLGLIHSLNRRPLLLPTPSTCRGEIFSVPSLGQSSRGKYFWRYPNFLITQIRIGQRKPASTIF